MLLFFFLGLVLPFVLILGVIGYVFALPFLQVGQWVRPHWARLSPHTRYRIKWGLIWATSGLAWLLLLTHGGL